MVAHLMREGTAQATVEMAIVAPVLIVLAIIVYNVMVFTSAVARFDRVAPDIVIAHGVSPAGDGKEDAADVIAAQLREAMEGYEVKIEVVCEQEEDPSTTILTLIVSPRTYRCTMRYAPWPTGISIAGVPIGAPLALAHERAVAVDPWRPGVIV